MPAINDNIELLPQIPKHFRVSLGGRVMPVMMKFRFYNRTTRERMSKSDVHVYLSSTHTCPSEKHHQRSKENPKVLTFYTKNPYAGNVLPEYHRVAKKWVKFPQDLYLTMQSYGGCLCTLTIEFPTEKEKADEAKMYDALFNQNKDYRGTLTAENKNIARE